MKSLRLCFNIISCLAVISFSGCNGTPVQQSINFTDINLIDTLKYAQYNASDIHNYNYPPANLFDADFKTCWVCGSGQKDSLPSLFIKLPERNDVVLNIFPGYGKSKTLFEMNARPKKINLSLFVGINPDGYVSENAVLYKAVKFPKNKVIHLADSFAVRSISLDFFKEDISGFRTSVYQHYDSTISIPRADTCLILKMDIVETYPGTKYDDICISEIFFNDRFISQPVLKPRQTEKIYLNSNENALLVDDGEEQGIVIYQDTSSVLQIIETTEDKKWVILISMPAEIEGRAATTYLLVDIPNKKVVNEQLEQYTGNYVHGSELNFEAAENGSIYLMYSDKDLEYFKIELK